jgi:hypothetical protein
MPPPTPPLPVAAETKHCGGAQEHAVAETGIVLLLKRCVPSSRRHCAMVRTTKNSQNTPRGRRAAAAAAAPAAATKTFVSEVPMKHEAATGGGKEKKSETKHHGCSREELLNRILEIREQIQVLQKVRTKGKNGKKKGSLAKLCTLPKDDRLKVKSYQRELAELDLELRKRDMRFVTKGFGKNMIGLNLDSTRSIHASVADDGVGDDGYAAEQDVVFTSTDDEVGGALAAPVDY